MKLKDLKQKILRFAGRFLLVPLVKVLCNSLKINFINKKVVDDLSAKNQNYILAFWHGTMILPWYLHKNNNFAALISKSKDGDLLANLLTNLKYHVVRGSSSSGGSAALESLIKLAKSGFSVAITPDGPRGPIYKMKPGAVITAQRSSLALVLVGIGFKKKRILKSWDKFEIPAFFTQSNVIYSEPIYIDRNSTHEQTASVIARCENKLNELQDKANKF
jgi:lysophospholipid acyltransferase (LPLAT)-like uncharacterized protein